MKGSDRVLLCCFLGGVKIHLTQKKMTINYLNVFLKKLKGLMSRMRTMRFFSKLLAVMICLLTVVLSGQAVEQTAQDAAFDWRAFRDRLNAANPGLNLTDRNFLSCERLVVREHYVDGESEQTPMGKGYTNRLTISRPPKPAALNSASVNTKGVVVRTLPKRPNADDAEKLVDASPCRMLRFLP